MRLRRLWALVIVIAALTAFAAPARAADMDIRVGDWWEYDIGGSLEDLSFDVNGTVNMEVVEVVKESVMGQAQDVFLVECTGSATLSGEIENLTASGEISIMGELHKLASNFSTSSQDLMMVMDIEVPGMSMSMTMGMEIDYDPVLDDYPGDVELASGITMHSRCEAMMSSWLDFMGTNESETTTVQIDLSMDVTVADVTVSTPAGDFKCYKIVVSGTIPDSGSYSTTYYYSDEVGNFVKIMGDGDLIFGFPQMELKAYSHGGSGSILSGTTGVLVIGTVAAAVLIAVIALILMKSRGRTPTPVYPPQPGPQPEMPPPPPPPPPVQ